jgi:hypothetical protein
MACLLLPLALVACATRPAPDFGGKWRPINHFAETTQAIPLQPAYEYYASPMDGTLKNMLTRWAKDSKMTLSYLSSYDFTLYAPVADMRTSSLQQAISQLNSAYAAEHISIAADGRQIVVRATGMPAAAAPAEAP